MGLKNKKILGINIFAGNIKNVLEETRKYLKKSKFQNPKSKEKGIKPMIIFTPNPEIIVYSQNDKSFKEIVNSAQINIPDGRGITWALKKLFGIRIRPIPGADLMKNLCGEAAHYGYRIGLIGGRDGLAINVSECLRKSYPKLKIGALGEPDISISNFKFQISNSKNNEKYFEELIRRISEEKIDILFVALGFPKQEYFIENVKIQMLKAKYEKPLLMMGVGGSFDYISGRIKRAPFWMREYGLEWLFRLLQEPWRIKRHITGSQFFLKVLFSKH